MTVLTCSTARRMLQAFHDEELAVSDQIAVSTHVDQCDECAAELEDLQSLGAAIRSSATLTRTAHSLEEDRSLERNVVARLNAEQSVSLATRAREIFDDMRLVYAGLGATAAAVACFLLMLNMMRFATADHRPDSLAAKMNTLASLESNQGVVRALHTQIMPVVSEARLLNTAASGAPFAADFEDDLIVDNLDAEFVILGIVTREGRVIDVQLVHASSGQTVEKGTKEANAFQKMIGAVEQSRYKPALVDGLPVAVNKVWPVAHTTVHGSREPQPLGQKTSLAGKKRMTSVPGRSLRSSAV